MNILEVAGLRVTLPTERGEVTAVHDVTLRLERRRILGIVGESGSGKSMTALAIMGLLPPGARARGSVVHDGRNLLGLGEEDWCRIRGNAISMVFQEPMTSLNPLHPIGRQVRESLLLHRGMSGSDANREALRLLERVGIAQARHRLGAYPHQLSGGQRQRVMIAIALSCEPDVLIADEPTTALDVTTQRQVLDLLDDLVGERDMAMILISHNLAMIGERADEVAVMYGGRVVETAPTERLFTALAHPYTRGLFGAMPVVGQEAGTRLTAIPGTVPDLVDLPPGCAFAPRCPRAVARCGESPPPLDTIGPDHRAACYAPVPPP